MSLKAFEHLELKKLRIGSFMGALAYPFIGLYYISKYPELEITMLERYISTSAYLILIVLSYGNKWAEKYFNELFLLVSSVVVGNYVHTVAINDYHSVLFVGLMVLVFCICVVGITTYRGLVGFFGLLAVSILYAFYIKPEAIFSASHQIKGMHFLYMFIVMGLLTWINVAAKLRLLSEVRCKEAFLKEKNNEIVLKNKALQKGQQIFENLAKGISGETGRHFYNKLVQSVVNTLDVNWCFIGRYNPDDQRVEVFSNFKDQRHQKTFSYSLKETPCENVVGKELCVYPQGVADLFPNDEILSELKIDSYIGAPLIDSDGESMGLIVVCDTKPLVDVEFMKKVMSLFAVRATAEMERQRQDDVIEDQNRLAAESEKLVTLGEMAAGIAHEINNPLAIIKGTAGTLVRKVKALNAGEKGQVVVEKLEVINSTCERINKIIHGIKVSVHNGENQAETLSPHSVEEVVDSSIPLCIPNIKKHGILFDQHIKDLQIKIHCRITEINQIIINLVNNAVFALEGVEQPSIQIRAEEIGDNIELMVVDNGPGVPEELVEKIMKPFFTTRKAGVGTGLGLSLSVRIMKEHGGELQYRRVDGETQFVMAFPKEIQDINQKSA